MYGSKEVAVAGSVSTVSAGMSAGSRARVARRIAAGAAFGGGGIGLIGAAPSAC